MNANVATGLIVLWAAATLGFLVWAIVAQTQLDSCRKGGNDGDTSSCEAPVPGRSGPAFSTVSYNILNPANELPAASAWSSWSERRQSMVESMRDEMQADVFGLQEATVSQRTYLTAALGDEYAWFGDLRQDLQESNPIVYRKSKFEMIEGETVRFPTQPSEDGKEIYQRIFTWALMRFRDDPGYRVLLVCTHMYKKSQKAAQAQARLRLQEFIAARRAILGPNVPIVLMADWNPGDYNVATELVNNGGGQLVNTDPRQSGVTGTRPPDERNGDSHYMVYARVNGTEDFDARGKFDSFVYTQESIKPVYSTVVRYLRISSAVTDDRAFVANSDHDPVLSVWQL